MLFSDDDLIAYLLGDASDEFIQRLQQRLPLDDDLLQRLTSLRLMLGQINATNCIFEPPADLVDTTLERIDQSRMPPAANELVPASEGEPAAAPLNEDLGDVAAELAPQDALAHSRRHLVRPSELNTAPGISGGLPGQARRRSLWDSTALTVSLTLLSCMFLPALVRIRFESRKAQCARNLELTGSELIGYALNHPQRRFPHVALDGPQAFAGVFAIFLREAGGQVPSSQLRCPSLIGCDIAANVAQVSAKSTARVASITPPVADIASFSELHNLAEDELQLAQHAVGGDYAYNLGVSEWGQPRAPKYEGRSQFAILADAPVPRSSDHQPNASRLENFIAHQGEGHNIFYEDGHVKFVTADSIRSLSTSDALTVDNPFENQLGAHELGVHTHDASLAPSYYPPRSN